MNKNTNEKINYSISLIIILIILLLLRSWPMQEVNSQIKENTSYAIGKYEKYSTSGSGYAGTSHVYISFNILEKNIYTESKGKMAGVKRVQEGDKFLVIYDRLNPENCQILFDYPIKDSSDFKRYLEEFKVKPLDIDKYF